MSLAGTEQVPGMFRFRKIVNEIDFLIKESQGSEKYDVNL